MDCKQVAGRAKSGSGADTRQLPTPQLGLFRKEKKRARAAQVRGVLGSPPGSPRCGTGKVGSQRSRPARPPAAARGAASSPRVSISPPFFLSRWLGRRCLLFIYFFIAIEIKHPLGAIETSGRLYFCNPPRTSPRWGRAPRAELERDARPAAAEDWLPGGREPNIYVIF